MLSTIAVVSTLLFPEESGSATEAGVEMAWQRAVTLRMLLELVFGVLVTMALAYAVEKRLSGVGVDFREALATALVRWPVMLWTGLMAGLVLGSFSFVGFLAGSAAGGPARFFLLVPGIVWGVYYGVCYTFISFVVALRPQRGWAALSYSVALVKGRWGRVFRVVVALTFFELLLTIMLGALLASFPGGAASTVAADVLGRVFSAFFTLVLVLFFLNLDQVERRPTLAAWAPPEDD